LGTREEDGENKIMQKPLVIDVLVRPEARVREALRFLWRVRRRSISAASSLASVTKAQHLQAPRELRLMQIDKTQQVATPSEVGAPTRSMKGGAHAMCFGGYPAAIISGIAPP
jgi:hypothetical protein